MTDIFANAQQGITGSTNFNANPQSCMSDREFQALFEGDQVSASPPPQAPTVKNSVQFVLAALSRAQAEGQYVPEQLTSALRAQLYGQKAEPKPLEWTSDARQEVMSAGKTGYLKVAANIPWTELRDQLPPSEQVKFDILFTPLISATLPKTRQAAYNILVPVFSPERTDAPHKLKTANTPAVALS